MPAAGALQQRCPHRPRFVVPASRTTKTLRPAELTQILSTGLLGGETRLELGQIPRIIFHFPDPTSCGHLSQVNTHPDGLGAIYDPGGYIIFRRFEPPGILALPFSSETLTATGKPFVIAEGEAPLSVSQNGTLVYLEPVAGLQQLVWLDRQGNRIGTTGEPFEGTALFALSPDDKRVAVVNWVEQANPDIWIHEVDRPIKTRVTTHEGRDLAPIWSPDGKRLVFASSRQGDRNLFVKQADGGGEASALLLSPTTREYPTDWSRDGNTVLFMRLSPTDTVGGDLSYLRRKLEQETLRSSRLLGLPPMRVRRDCLPTGDSWPMPPTSQDRWRSISVRFPTGATNRGYRSTAACSRTGERTARNSSSNGAEFSWRLTYQARQTWLWGLRSLYLNRRRWDDTT